MRRSSGEEYDEEAARRQPLLHSRDGGSGQHGGIAGGADSLSVSPDRGEDGLPGRHLSHGASIRLTKRSSTAAHDAAEEQHGGGLVLKDAGDHKQDSDVREFEVEVVAGAVAEAVAEAVQEAVAEAVHDAVQQAIEENVQFDVRANIYTLVAVTGVILFWRGVWNTWDVLFGTELHSNLGSMVVGLVIMSIIRIWNLPLVEGLPGG